MDAQHGVISLWKDNPKLDKFSFTGPVIRCGLFTQHSTKYIQQFPYPATENWQKAIGAHSIWLSGMVWVNKTLPGKSDVRFKMNFTLHAEDQYNFNTGGDIDIATGIPDSENGSLVTAGLANGYLHTSTLFRSFSWDGTDLGVRGSSYQTQGR